MIYFVGTFKYRGPGGLGVLDAYQYVTDDINSALVDSRFVCRANTRRNDDGRLISFDVAPWYGCNTSVGPSGQVVECLTEWFSGQGLQPFRSIMLVSLPGLPAPSVPIAPPSEPAIPLVPVDPRTPPPVVARSSSGPCCCGGPHRRHRR